MAELSVPESDFIIIGRIGSPYGVKGWVKIISFTEPFDNIMNYKPLYLKKGGKWQAADVENMRHHGKGIVAQFSDCQDRNTAQLLTNNDIAIERSQLPELSENEYYWEDLIGLTVINQDEKILGRVDQILDTGSNNVLVITNQGKPNILIPYLFDEVVIKVDLAEQKIHVDWHDDEE